MENLTQDQIDILLAAWELGSFSEVEFVAFAERIFE